MRPGPAFAAAIILTTVLGSVHAFSVFVIPIETALGAGRDAVSLVYGIALAFLTVGVLVGSRLWRLASPATVGAAAFLLAAAGSALAAVPNLTALYLGYGVMFGFAIGSGYGFALVIVNHAMPARRGMATGVVTATFALGAMAASLLFREANAAAGYQATLLGASVVFLVCAVVVAILIKRSGLIIPWSANRKRGAARHPATPGFPWLWLGFGAGSMAGLMALGHAAAVMEHHGASPLLVTGGVMFITGTNACGSFAAGWLADRGLTRQVMFGLPLLAIVGLGWLATTPGGMATVLGLAIIQIAYGGVIAVYPIVTTAMVGPTEAARVYGLAFTSWGIAGFAGPWIAGLLFEASGGYATAFFVAALVAAFSCLATLPLRRHMAA